MWPDDTAYAACDEAKATKRMLILSVRTAAHPSPSWKPSALQSEDHCNELQLQLTFSTFMAFHGYSMENT